MLLGGLGRRARTHGPAIVAAISVVMGAAAPAAAADPPSHFRLLLHGFADVPDAHGFGLGGWVVAPDVSTAPGKWLGIVGPRYAQPTWNIELMGGAYVSDLEGTSVVDSRAELTALMPFYAWANVEYIDLFAGARSQFYAYAQADFAVARRGATLALVGVETEDLWGGGIDDVSVGPHLFVPLGPLVLQVAYQRHHGAPDALWLRALFTAQPPAGDAAATPRTKS